MDWLKRLSRPSILYARSAVLAKPCPVPEDPGLYAWFFTEVPDRVPTDGCVVRDGLTLLYVGSSPQISLATQKRTCKSPYSERCDGAPERGIEMDHNNPSPNSLTVMLALAPILMALAAILMAGLSSGWLLP
jgi:hypothetical protein